MTDTTIVIPSGSIMDALLDREAAASGHSKADVALDGLLEWLEDREEEREVLERVARNEPAYTLEDVRRHLGLDDHDSPLG